MTRGLSLLLVFGVACGRSEPHRLPRLDAGIDAGIDAGTDAGVDAGVDAGPAPCLPAPGCADGTREAFFDGCRYPSIAGCAGGFTVAGVFGAVPRCERRGGNDFENANGAGCSVEDLCASGWHLCRSSAEVARSSPDGCAGAGVGPQFFVTAQSGPGCGICATGSAPGCTGGSCQVGCLQSAATANDVFGCGALGDIPDPGSCAPLNRFGNNLCSLLGDPWSCGTDGEAEAHALIKPSPDKGGALCCRD